MSVKAMQNPKTNKAGSFKGSNLLLRMRKHYQLYLLLFPAILWYLIFNYVPLYGLQIAFKDYNPALGFLGSRWVGTKFFKSFFRSYYFWPIIRNTLTISFYSLFAGMPIPIILALMLNEVGNVKYRKFVQTVTYAPHFISTVVLIGMVIIFLTPGKGMLTRLFLLLGVKNDMFLTSPSAFKHIYIWSGIWQQSGWSSIIYLAALSGVDPGLHEAAMIDGATRMQRIWHINIPTILPTIAILLILRTGSIMSVGFEKVFLLQNPLNMETSEVISTYIYKRGLIKLDFSFSTAVGLFNNIINFILLVISNELSKWMGETSLF